MFRLTVLLLLAQSLAAQAVGPEQGALVIGGGALRNPAVWERFIALAGGPDANVVVIPTAGGADAYSSDWDGLDVLRRAGLKNLTVLHTYERAQADTDAFAAPIRRADAVWFGGGRQWRLADSYLDTKVHDEIRALLARGGVVGGSSAGATIQGEYLARGDTKANTIMMGDHEDGLALLRGVAIDQHLLRRNRQFDLLEVVRARPDLLGIGIDEDTAIVVQGDAFEVVGSSYVALYDAHDQARTSRPFYLLQAGEKFDLKSRRPIESK